MSEAEGHRTIVVYVKYPHDRHQTSTPSKRGTGVFMQMSNMDSERCWGEPSDCEEEYDCGPNSGVLLPAVYTVDPAQVQRHHLIPHTVVLY